MHVLDSYFRKMLMLTVVAFIVPQTYEACVKNSNSSVSERLQ